MRDDIGIIIAFWPDNNDGGETQVLWQWIACTRVERIGGKFLRVVDN